MRLRRKDLVEQFEEIVKQEIINHNKLMEQTNGQLRWLASENTGLENSIDELRKDHQNQLDEILDMVRENSHEIHYNRRVQEARINDLEQQIICLKEEIHKLKTQKENILQLFEKAQLISLSNSEIARELRRNLESLRVYINESLGNQNRSYQHKLDQLENRILSRKDPIPEVKEELESKIKEAKVDKDGIQREMRVDRRALFILEKKIEDIYNKMDKLNRGEL